MSKWERLGESDEWYTPAHVFQALGERFDLDVAHPPASIPTHVPCDRFISAGSLEADRDGFVWMNPPFGGRNALQPWLDKFFAHGDGLALTPDRTSAPWWQTAATRAEAMLFTHGKIKFLRPDGSEGRAPGSGTTLFAAGTRATTALQHAAQRGFGICVRRA